MTGPYLSVAQVAELLAVDHKVIRRAIERGELPALRVGRLLRVDPADLETLAYRPSGAPDGRPARPRGSRPPRGQFSRRARGAGPDHAAQ